MPNSGKIGTAKPQIVFKSKIIPQRNRDGSVAYEIVPFPMLRRSHCDMDWFRRSRAFRNFADTTMFPYILKDVLEPMGVTENREWVRLDQLPAGMTVERDGDVATVSILIRDERRP